MKHILYKLPKAFFFFLYFFLAHSQLNAQFLNDEFCGTKEVLDLDYRKKPWKGKNSFLFDYLDKINYGQNPDSVRYLVPIKFWVYCANDGSGGVSELELKGYMENLNHFQILNNTGFRYYIREIEAINKTSKLKLGYYLEAPWQTVVHHAKGCINVYVSDSIKKNHNGAVYTVRGTYNIATKSVLIQRNTTTTGLSHEIGHYFGLLHPHRNYNKGKSKQESVSRTRAYKNSARKGLNCERNGDGLADTPAEPQLSYLVANDCHFTGYALTDNWGDHYQSATNNIMSYPTHYRCRDSFTEGQKAVMLYSASENKYAMHWATKYPENKVYCFDQFEPDDTKDMASVIGIEERQKHTFHKIFIPKEKEVVSDQTDWLKFELIQRNTDQVRVVVEVDNVLADTMSVSLLNEDAKLLACSEVDLNCRKAELMFENLPGGWYFLKINSTQTISEKLVNYTIQLEID